MPPDARLVGLRLRVRDLDAVGGYYRDVLGLDEAGRDGGVLKLAPAGRGFVLELEHVPGAPLRPYPCPGLYHFALVVPDRPALGAVMRHVHEAGAAFEGMADHAVSEALYLRDPELNGIELYRDRPEAHWPTDAGEVVMGSAPLDVEGLRREAPEPRALDPDTRFGHIHLHMRTLEEGEAFYGAALGLRVRQRTYIGALFLAAGDYHHHVGLNVWAKDGDPPPDATGLVSYQWSVEADAVTDLVAHLEEAGTPYERDGAAVLLRDPVGVVVRVGAKG
jgi:catechol 2,3-dioxygenase